MFKMSQHRAKANIAKDYCDPFALATPAPSNSDMLAHIRQSPPRASATPLLDLLGGYSRSPAALTEPQGQRAFFDRPCYGNTAAQEASKATKSNPKEIASYNNDNLTSTEMTFEESLSPMESQEASPEVESPPSWVDAKIPEGPETVSLDALPSNIDPAREVIHPEYWFQKQHVDKYIHGNGYIQDGKHWAAQMSMLYGDEQTDSRFRGNPGNWTKDCSDPQRREVVKLGTQHWNDKVIDEHSVGIREGLMMLDDKPLDTTGATGIGTLAKPGTKKAEMPGKGKYLFAMDKDGRIVVADAWDEHTEHLYGTTSVLGDNNELIEKDAVELRTVNHSTLLGGAHAAAAGEMRIENGKLIELNDTSGHYKPGSFLTAQLLRELAERGIDISRLKIQLTDPNTLEPIFTSALELLEIHKDFLQKPDEKSAVDKRHLIKGRGTSKAPASADDRRRNKEEDTSC